MSRNSRLSTNPQELVCSRTRFQRSGWSIWSRVTRRTMIVAEISSDRRVRALVARFFLGRFSSSQSGVSGVPGGAIVCATTSWRSSTASWTAS